jgi:hypothetical protein
MATKERGILPLLSADENAGGEKGRAPGEWWRRSLEGEVAYNRSLPTGYAALTRVLRLYPPDGS